MLPFIGHVRVVKQEPIARWGPAWLVTPWTGHAACTPLHPCSLPAATLLSGLHSTHALLFVTTGTDLCTPATSVPITTAPAVVPRRAGGMPPRLEARTVINNKYVNKENSLAICSPGWCVGDKSQLGDAWWQGIAESVAAVAAVVLVLGQGWHWCSVKRGAGKGCCFWCRLGCRPRNGFPAASNTGDQCIRV